MTPDSMEIVEISQDIFLYPCGKCYIWGFEKVGVGAGYDQVGYDRKKISKRIFF
jgi:hypothetical protein